MAKSIWFDITRIYNWNGPIVGFVRVELESARHLLIEFKNQTRFCRYDSVRGYHREVCCKEVEAHIRRLDSYAEAVRSHQPEGSGWSIKGFIKAAIRRLPRRLQDGLIRYLLKQWRIMAKIRQAPVRLIFTLLRQREQSIEPELRRGDVYVTVGLNSEANIFPGLYAIKKRTGIGVMAICYDLIPVKFPHFVESDQLKNFAQFTESMATCADKILCISQNTLRDLELFLSTAKIRCPDLGVIRLGADIGIRKGPIGPQVRVICRTPYIIFVANIEPRKNHEILYRAYKQLMREDLRHLPKLVFVGRTGWGTDSFLSNLRLDRSVHGLILMLNHVSDFELSYLYRHALFTVYPSLYEGWGLPVAESLVYGKFCIASSSSSLPEVGGRFVEYLDPRDLSAWVERLAYHFNHRKAIRDREAEIRSHYGVYTWAKTARTLANRALSL